ncbi:OmpA family protein [Cellulophaga baltica]|uniref:OmpA family protein n=1 Tax=Cellulophaga TaxID=104264 RepID=UPI001C074C62|nr:MULTISPECIES: OmpA family protein [Cellulophaga]MBU2996460.1 OmpA family protein [Cellulophaga baltica]MDO6767854.1 OmpA family protein [Cellulophaga sp. 1_MG-2023]
MKKQHYIILLCFLGVFQSTFAQKYGLKKASESFDNYSYAKAIETYEQLVSKGYESQEIYENLGDANYNNGDYEEASNWYGKLFDLKETTIGTEYYFRYAQSLKSVGDYKKSDNYMRKFNKSKKNDLRALKFSNNIDYLKKINNSKTKFTLKPLSVNSKESDFAPSLYEKGLVFASARDSGTFVGNIHKWTNKPFLNLFKADTVSEGEYAAPVEFSSELNGKTNESSTVFTKDGTTVYFTRNNSENGNFVEDETGLSRLKIYSATLESGKWTNITELPFNSNSYSTANPTLSADEKTMYFASDMEPSYGASDIFKVEILEDGSFGTPENLGETINTEARETFPFIAADNELYFASDGHPGLGGLDMYSIKLDSDEVLNLGAPVNSNKDDFSLILDEENSTGFFASNREGGVGDDDIYGFEYEKQEEEQEVVYSKINGTVIDKVTGEAIPFARITVYDYSKNELREIDADFEGKFASEIEFPNIKYRFVSQAESYNDATAYLITPIGEVDETLGELDFIIAMEKGEASTVIGADLVKILEMNPIYFSLNSSYLNRESYPELDKVVAYMKENPNTRVEVGSHSDSRDSDRYNIWLSDRRAKSTVKYIVSMGIDTDRITGKGYGESQLVNKCSNDVECSEEEHALNRRSEFIVYSN